MWKEFRIPGIGDYEEPEPREPQVEYDEDYDVRIDDMWDEWDSEMEA